MKEMLDDNNIENTNEDFEKQYSLEEKANILKEYINLYKIPIRPTAIYKGNRIGEWQTQLRSLASSGSLELSSDIAKELVDLEILPEKGFIDPSFNNANEEDFSENLEMSYDDNQDENKESIDDKSMDAESIEDYVILEDSNPIEEDKIDNIIEPDSSEIVEPIENDLNNENENIDVNSDANLNKNEIESIPNILDYTEDFVQHSPAISKEESLSNEQSDLVDNFSDLNIQKYNNLAFLELSKSAEDFLIQTHLPNAVIDLISLKQSGELLNSLNLESNANQDLINEIINSVPDTFTIFANRIAYEQDKRKSGLSNSDSIENSNNKNDIIDFSSDFNETEEPNNISEPEENLDVTSDNNDEDSYDLSKIDFSGIDLSDLSLDDDENKESIENESTENEPIEDNTTQESNSIEENVEDPNMEEDIILPSVEEDYIDNNNDNDLFSNLEDVKVDDFTLDNSSNSVSEPETTPELNFDLQSDDDVAEEVKEPSFEISDSDLDTSNEPEVPVDNEISNTDINNLDDNFQDLNENYITYSNDLEHTDAQSDFNLNAGDDNTFNDFNNISDENTNITPSLITNPEISYVQKLTDLSSKILLKAEEIVKYNRNLPVIQCSLYEMNSIIKDISIRDEAKKEKLEVSYKKLETKLEKNNNDKIAIQQEINALLDSF